MKLSVELYSVAAKFGDIKAIELIGQAGFDAIVNIVKGLGVWVKIKAYTIDKLLRNNTVIKTTFKALDSVLGTAFYGSRYFVQILSKKSYF